MGAGEMVRDLSTRRFVASARKLLPGLEVSDVLPGPSGIRAQALAPDGTLLDDFVFHESDGVVHVRNAPSPGATSSLAIAGVDRRPRRGEGCGRGVGLKSDTGPVRSVGHVTRFARALPRRSPSRPAGRGSGGSGA